MMLCRTVQHKMQTQLPLVRRSVVITDIHNLCRPRGYTSTTGKKFQEIYYKFRSKCAHGIWTLTLLMFLRVSYNALTITHCIYVTDNKIVSVINAVCYLLVLIQCHYFYRVGTMMEMCNVLMTISICSCSCLE